VYPLWKTIWGFFRKLKIELPCNPAIPRLGIQPKQSKSAYDRDTCTLMFTASFTIARLWNQPTCPSNDERIQKMCIYTMQYYLAIKKKEVMLAEQWMEL
jgi:hypothetical protein